eukprot:4229838-Amphidinium_carterae.1
MGEVFPTSVSSQTGAVPDTKTSNCEHTRLLRPNQYATEARHTSRQLRLKDAQAGDDEEGKHSKQDDQRCQKQPPGLSKRTVLPTMQLSLVAVVSEFPMS